MLNIRVTYRAKVDKVESEQGNHYVIYKEPKTIRKASVIAGPANLENGHLPLDLASAQDRRKYLSDTVSWAILAQNNV